MMAFWITAALAAALGVLLLWWRSRHWATLFAGLLGVAGAFALYLLTSNYEPQAPGPEEQQARARIAALQAAARQQPDHAGHWLQLGQGYLQLGQYGLAETALMKASRLHGGRNADVLAALAETRALDGDQGNDAGVNALFEEVLTLDPVQPKALFYTALAALQTGQLPLARERLARLLAGEAVPTDVQAALRKQIASLDAEIAANKSAGARGGAAGGDATTVRLAVAVGKDMQSAYQAKAASGATLFVFVRNPGGGPPLAVKRLPPGLPAEIVLSAADAMLAGNGIQPRQQVSVAARLSASGSPTAQSGDLYGEATTTAGSGQLVNVVIDKIAP